MTAREANFIHQFVPAGDTKSRLTLLLLHGTGGNEHDLIPLGRHLAPGSALLSPRGKILEHGMPRFFRRLSEGVFDIPDLIARTEELADFVGTAISEYGLDPDKVVAVGYSNGANIAASMLLLRPDVLSGALLLHAMVPLFPNTSPDLSGVPVFLSGGRTDRMVPASETAQLAELLRQYGAEVTLHWEEGGHGLTPAEIHAATSWLAQHQPNYRRGS